MPQSYEVIYHLTFTRQATEIKKKYPQIEEHLIAALGEIKANPIPGALKYVTNPRLKGMIHKIHVGGRKGHRMIYLFLLKTVVVIPVFLSPDPKPPFKYDYEAIEVLCTQFLEDYSKKNYGAFTNWKKKAA